MAYRARHLQVEEELKCSGLVFAACRSGRRLEGPRNRAVYVHDIAFGPAFSDRHKQSKKENGRGMYAPWSS